MPRLARPFLLVLPLAALAAWWAVRGLPADGRDGTLALRTNLAVQGRLELVELEVGSAGVSALPLLGLADRWRAAIPGLDVAVLARPAAREAAEERGRGAARVVSGPFQDPLVARLLGAARLPFEHGPGPGEVQVAGRVYRADTAAVACTFEDPERVGLPMTVIAGAPTARARAAELLAPSCAPRCVVWVAGERDVELALGPRGGPRLSTLRAFSPSGARDGGAPVADGRLAAGLGARLAAARPRLSRWFPGATLELPAIGSVATVERLQRDLPADIGARIDLPHGQLLALGGERHEADVFAAWVEAALVRAAGRPRDAWLATGVAVELADGVLGEPLRTAWAVLDPPSASVAIHGEARPPTWSASPFEALAAAGAIERRVGAALLSRAVIAAFGDAGLARIWRDGLAETERAEVARAAAALLAEAVAATSAGAREGAAPWPTNLRGVVLVTPARPDERGHGTIAVRDAALRVAGLGADAALVTAHIEVPRAVLGAPRCLEGDAAVVRTCELLREAGLEVVLSIQPLTSESGLGPCDSTQLGSAALWREAVARHAAGVRHGAWLARWAGVDAVSIARGAPHLFGVPWSGAGPEPAWHAAVRAEKELGWVELAREATRARARVTAIAPGLELAGAVPRGAGLGAIAVEVAPGVALGEVGERVVLVGLAEAPRGVARRFLRAWDVGGAARAREDLAASAPDVLSAAWK